MSAGSSKAYKVAILAALALVIAVGVVAKGRLKSAAPATPATPVPPATASEGASTPTAGMFPALIDLGMGRCLPCKEMKPILEELAQEYKGRARIEIIDIGDHPEQADKYRVEMMPTQVFLDANGNEVYRHVGFMPKEDIIAQFEQMAISPPGESPAETPTQAEDTSALSLPDTPARRDADVQGATLQGMENSAWPATRTKARSATSVAQLREASKPGPSAPAGRSEGVASLDEEARQPANPTPPSGPGSAKAGGVPEGQVPAGATCACQLPGWVATGGGDASQSATSEDGSGKGEKPNVEQAH